MKLTFSYIKLVVASATALLTAAVCLFLVHLIHKQHTTHMPAPPTNDETSLHTPLLWQPWLFPRTGHASSDVSIPHIEGTSHKKKTKKKVASLPAKTSPGQGTLEHKVAAQHQSVPHSSSHNPKPNTRQAQNSAPSAKPAAKRQPEQTTPNPVRLPSIPVRTVFAYVPYYSKSISLQDIAHHSSAFTETADWSFSLEQNGSIHGMPNQSLLDYAHAHGMHVYASITNNYSSALAAHVLTSAPARARLIQQLVKLSTQYHYSGVNLDIEHITAANRGQFTAFVSNLAKALHHQGKLLTLAVPAIDAAPQERGYDLAALGREADGLVMMAYDYTYLTQQPGPIAPLGWVKQVLQFNLQSVPANKLILGIGTYGYEWGGAKAKALSEKAADEQLAAKHMTTQENPASKATYYQFTSSSGQKYVLYYETSSAVRQLITLAQTRRLRGVALWHAGEEDNAVAKLLQSYR